MHDWIRQEQIRILYANRNTAFFGSFTIALITLILLWPILNQAWLSAWFAATLGLLCVRWYLCRGYDTQTREEQDSNHRSWGRQFVYGSLAMGLLWGLVPILFYPKSTDHYAMLLVMHAGYIAGAASATSIYLPTFTAFVLPSSVMFFIGTIVHGTLNAWMYAVLIVVYAITITVFAIRNNRSVAEQVSLRLQNNELMTDLRKQRDRAENAMIAKNRFLAAASHDLRQPVHALGLFVASLESHQEYEERQHILGKIKQSTGALGGLFHGLLDISKLDANVVENNPEDVNLDEILTILKTQFQDTANEKNLLLAIPANTNLIAHVDSSLLERILRNLVDNAINYTEQGSVSVSVADIGNNKLVLSVNDTGKGIPPGEHENIFSEYHQLENPERNRQKGLGLGLAIVRRLCNLMDIPIEVVSHSGSGALFKLTLKKGSRSRIPVPAPVPQQSQHHSLNIVVIDDEQDIIDGMQRILTSWGCKTISATSTLGALSALDREDEIPDVIIADFRLLGNDSGLDSIRDIREEYNLDIPAVLVTGDTAPERLQQAAKASIQVLHKPVEPARLRQLLNQICSDAA